MSQFAIFALSGLSENGEPVSISVFLLVLLAFAPIGLLLSGGWSVVGGLTWLSIDVLMAWRIWSSVTAWGNRRGWFTGWTWATASALVLFAFLGLNLIVAAALALMRDPFLTSP
jgi:hypothetical protein